MDKRSKKIKTIALGAFWCLMVVIYIFRLFSLQIIHGEENLENATKRSYKTQTSVAVRGEILDADGLPIVTNRMGLSVTVDMAYITKGEENSTCGKLISILKDEGVEIKDGLPMTKQAPYRWEAGKESAVSKLLKTLKLSENATPDEALNALKERYGIESSVESYVRELSGFRYEMELRAFTDMEVTSFSYETLRRMCVDDGELAAEILEQNCDFISYLFYQDMNRAYTSTPEHVCDILYLYLLNVEPKDGIIPFSQSELASLVGISRPQIERILKSLREKQVLSTMRGGVQITDISKLYDACSADIRSFNPLSLR